MALPQQMASVLSSLQSTVSQMNALLGSLQGGSQLTMSGLGTQPPVIAASDLATQHHHSLHPGSYNTQPVIHPVPLPSYNHSNPNPLPRSNPTQAFRFPKEPAQENPRSQSQNRRTPQVICFRCGIPGHVATSCRTSLFCSRFGKQGHITRQCRSAQSVSTMYQSRMPLGLKEVEEANRLPPIRMSSNTDNEGFLAKLRNGLVVRDFMGLGQVFIQSHLAKAFPEWQWVVRALPESFFLIEPSTMAWRSTILKKGFLLLGDVKFSVESFNPLKFDGGRDPEKVWVKVVGLPFHLWRDLEFRKIAEEMGGFYVDIDPRSGNHMDFNILRIRVGVQNAKAIPISRNMMFTDRFGNVRVYTLTFEVERNVENLFDPSRQQGQKRQWQEKGSKDMSGKGSPRKVKDTGISGEKIVGSNIGNSGLGTSQSSGSHKGKEKMEEGVSVSNPFTVLDGAELTYDEAWDPWERAVAISSTKRQKGGNSSSPRTAISSQVVSVVQQVLVVEGTEMRSEPKIVIPEPVETPMTVETIPQHPSNIMTPGGSSGTIELISTSVMGGAPPRIHIDWLLHILKGAFGSVDRSDCNTAHEFTSRTVKEMEEIQHVALNIDDQPKISTQTNQELAESVDELEIYLRNMLNELPGEPFDPRLATIFRLPGSIHDRNMELCEPKLVSIGPYHHGKESLRMMEEHKSYMLRNFIARGNVGLEVYLPALRAIETRARNCYSETVDMGSDDFVKILLLDGCFMLEWFFLYNSRQIDVFIDLGWASIEIFTDFCLLENQVPFFVLHVLWTIQNQGDLGRRRCEGQCSLLELLCSVLKREFDFTPFRPAHISCDEIYHLLHLCYTGVVPDSEPQTQGEQNNTTADISHKFFCLGSFIWSKLYSNTAKAASSGQRDFAPSTEAIPTISELHDAGVKFKRKKKPASVFDISFKNGTFEMPFLTIQSTTIRILWNMVAFEQSRKPWCLPQTLSSYLALMDNLVDTSKDVEILEQSGIFQNLFENAEEASSFFNQFDKIFVLRYSKHYFKDMFDDVREYSQKRWPRYRARLMQDYFSNPWTIISLVAACILLILTFLQTYFSAPK